MRITVLVATAASLAGCSVEPALWRAETVPAVIAPAAPMESKIVTCKPIDAAVATEAQRMTPLEAVRGGGIDALTAALMRSEAEKNARLRQAVAAYEGCRRTRQKS